MDVGPGLTEWQTGFAGRHFDRKRAETSIESWQIKRRKI
jgi:hypothetical protein